MVDDGAPPQGRRRGFRGIGLLDIVWKLLASVMNRRFQTSIEFHDALHGCISQRGTGTASIEAKLLQQWATLKQVPLYEIFLDLRKAYDAIDRDRTLDILEAYGVGENSRRLLTKFWASQRVVARQSGYYGEAFEAHRGVTQGDVISPTIFNIVVDADQMLAKRCVRRRHRRHLWSWKQHHR